MEYTTHYLGTNTNKKMPFQLKNIFKTINNNSGRLAAIFSGLTAVTAILGLFVLPAVVTTGITIGFALLSSAFWYHDAELTQKTLKKIENRTISKDTHNKDIQANNLHKMDTKDLKKYEKSFRKQFNITKLERIQPRKNSERKSSESNISR